MYIHIFAMEIANGTIAGKFKYAKKSDLFTQ